MTSLLERTAYHEAGHAVVALSFGIPIIGVTIATEVAHLHRGRYQPPHDCGLECMVTVSIVNVVNAASVVTAAAREVVIRDEKSLLPMRRSREKPRRRALRARNVLTVLGHYAKV